MSTYSTIAAILDASKQKQAGFSKSAAKVLLFFDICKSGKKKVERKKQFYLHIYEKSSIFAQFLIYGTTIIVFIGCDDGQFSVFRAGIGADVHIA